MLGEKPVRRHVRKEPKRTDEEQVVPRAVRAQHGNRKLSALFPHHHHAAITCGDRPSIRSQLQ